MFIDKRATAEKQLDAESLKSASIKRQICFRQNTMGVEYEYESESEPVLMQLEIVSGMMKHKQNTSLPCIRRESRDSSYSLKIDVLGRTLPKALGRTRTHLPARGGVQSVKRI